MVTRTFIRLLIILLVVSKIVNAQDIHFSQFYASKMNCNPSYIGTYVGDFRIANTYRNQWKAFSVPFTTNNLEIDKTFYVYNEKFTVGGMMIYDQSGVIELESTKLFGAFAYHKTIKNHNYHAGVQVGYSLKQYSSNGDYTFPNQFDMEIGKFNSEMSNYDPLKGESTGYYDMNFGLGWNNDCGRFKPYGGISFYHFIKPKESFTSEINKLPNRFTYTFGGEIALSSLWILKPDFILATQAKASNMVAGSRVGYRLSYNKAKAKTLYLGAYFRDGIRGRNTDAIPFTLGVDFEHLSVGVAYDITVSELNASGSKNAFEISFVYTGSSTVPKKMAIPCEIY